MADLFQRVWGLNWMGDSRTLDVHIRRLRQKLGDDPSAPRYIETVRGYSLRFVNPAASAWVDIGDVQAVASRWRDPALYDPQCDVVPGQPDGTINLRDIMAIANRLGGMCP